MSERKACAIGGRGGFGWRSTLGVLGVCVLVLLMGLAGPLTGARAQTKAYELQGQWVNPPARARSGFDVLTARWWLDVNDDAAAPQNRPTQPNVLTLTVKNARFNAIPTVCRTGAAKAGAAAAAGTDNQPAAGPASAISTDGTTLTCNLGVITEGTAVSLTNSLLATGPAEAKIALQGSFRGHTVKLPEIPLYTKFDMQAKFDGGAPTIRFINPKDADDVYVEFPFSLSHAHASAAGPGTVSFDINTTRANSSSDVILDVADKGCKPNYRNQSGYPFSDGKHPAEQSTAFPSCKLEKLGTDRFRLTLGGLTYGKTAPRLDSNNQPLPLGMDVIAAGVLTFQIRYTSGGNKLSLAASTPTFTAADSSTAVDAVNNNKNSIPIVRGSFTGGWALSAQRPKSYPGTPWTNTYKVPVGATVMAVAGTTPPHGFQTWSDNWICATVDTKYVDFKKARVSIKRDAKPNPYYDDSFQAGKADRDIWYYVGDKLQNPGSDAAVDPNEFACGGKVELGNPSAGNQAGWTQHPHDLSKVKAVKVRLQRDLLGQVTNGYGVVYLVLEERIKDTTPVGTHVWTWASSLDEGDTDWALAPNKHDKLVVYTRSRAAADKRYFETLTPGLRYPYAGPGRDVFEVVGSEPFVKKSVAKTEYLPGRNAEFSLKYGLQSNLADPHPDAVDLTDVLPQGLTYAKGSATAGGKAIADPEVKQVPASKPENGPQIPAHTELHWHFDAVTPNQAQPVITFQAQVSAAAEPGQKFVNTAVVASQGITRADQAEFQVPTAGSTALRKSVRDANIKPDAQGLAATTWTVRLHSDDPHASTLTDVIDKLPAPADAAGTTAQVAQTLVKVQASIAGSKIYYTTVPRAQLDEDPAAASNGGVGTPSSIWSEKFVPNATGVRVIGGPLAPGATQTITIDVQVKGLTQTAKYVNVAVGRAQQTRLRMRTSATMTVTVAKPHPSPQPSPGPEPQPGPGVSPQPSPQPSPGPGASPQPSPQPSPGPKPQPGPGASPQPSPVPSPGPGTSPQPSPSPQPQHPGAGSGTGVVPSPGTSPQPAPGSKPGSHPGHAPTPGASPQPGSHSSGSHAVPGQSGRPSPSSRSSQPTPRPTPHASPTPTGTQSPKPSPAPAARPPLARTGSQAGSAAALAALLVIGGAALAAVRLRRS